MKYISKLLGICLIVIVFAACSSNDPQENISAPFIGDVILESQAEVDEFASNQYGGVDGMLRLTSPGISTPSNITDISGLSSLKYITGDLDIFNNSIISLNGLQNITKIGGSLFLNFNEELTEINALSNLTTLGEKLVISSSESLLNIDGLIGLTKINDDLSIGVDAGPGALGVPNLAHLNGLSNITTVGGNLQISGTNIIDLQSLANITAINKDITISFNESLENLTGLEAITAVGGSFLVSNNQNIKEINALSNLQEIGAVLQIASNPELIHINGLSSLISVGNAIVMFSNNSLTSLGNAFENLERASNISLSYGAFESIDGFNNLTSADYIDVQNNLQLLSISGFENLPNCKYFTIGNNENLQSINGFFNLNSVEEFTLLQPSTISDPPISITAFSNLNTIVNNLLISGLANTDINFISNLEIVGDQLNITYNENLNNLCGLNTLVFNDGLGGEFNVFNNLYNPTQQDILNGNCSQ